MSMKLTGDYEFTETGVRIEGVIHDTRIPQIRKQFKNFQTIQLYTGEHAGNYGKAYKIPDASVLNSMKHLDLVKSDELKNVLSLPKDYDITRSGIDSDLSCSGILYLRGSGGKLMTATQGLYRSLETSGMRRIRRNLFNAAWIYSAVENDGHFSIELLGLCNRHILHMMLGRVTTFTKFLDGPVAQGLDKKNAMDLIEKQMGWL